MSGVNLSGIVKSYGAMQVVHGIDLTVAEKEFVVLVGPSGCGKSTTLRMIAGLEEITAGDLTIHDRRVNRIAPKDRDVAMVFQNYALYPHLNVADNMAFGLRIRKMPKNEIKTTIDDVAEILGLTEYLDRRPADLSGGQRQRVAMGRAIVRHPKVFLFDEPLSNLDAKLRTQMRAEIKRLHKRLGVTSVYVTHDQVEAMTLADRIVVMNNGAIEQIGTPMELFNNPSNTFVAGFLGSPPMNQMKGTLTDSGALVGDVEIKINGATGPHAGRNVIVGIRPEHVTLTAEEGTSPLPINLDLVEPLGSEALLHARHGEDNLVFKANTENDIDSLSGVNKVHIPAHLVKIFDADTGKALVLGD
ncbi:carbohydrate ABC transporter ATP-binding protein, CUT1 family [Litoreibacter ascidiaceicola]|uniref:Carbohydrate ABC transporter ATP-binding protein, CUT1 family n=1 Tax=Litoreibacter ascidiaceicola TaxID=1486859 RepID=A0A1M4T265_9RHOB|nr:sn-glycerol-3-phosphate ABC transporter ATP-binding protein UgpC [Litoreibacter ascidiaceicola]SHE38488.1 carbohydrate ABC transporter ATP-binding protein, CUT1 family [Litoreibacter ascidiaceicola]